MADVSGLPPVPVGVLAGNWPAFSRNQGRDLAADWYGTYTNAGQIGSPVKRFSKYPGTSCGQGSDCSAGAIAAGARLLLLGGESSDPVARRIFLLRRETRACAELCAPGSAREARRVAPPERDPRELAVVGAGRVVHEATAIRGHGERGDLGERRRSDVNGATRGELEEPNRHRLSRRITRVIGAVRGGDEAGRS